MTPLDRHILLWERRLLRFGRSDRADYIVHRINQLRAKRLRIDAHDGAGESS